MHTTYRLLVPLIFFFCIAGCSTQKPPSPIVFADNIMTINYRILVGEKLNTDQRVIVQKIIDDTFVEIDTIYNKWNLHSELSQLNDLPANQKKTLSPQLLIFFTYIDHFVNLTEGRFDPTIEPLHQLWKTYLEQGQIPPQNEIEHLKPAIGWDKISFKDGEFQKADDRTQLDFGGIAKGYCVDLLVERLMEAGLNNIFVEWGGEIRAQGQHPTRRPWSIFISKLGDRNPEHAIAQLDLNNRAIATSGDYYQSWTITLPDGQTKSYCHIFNPLTLSPLEVKTGSVASASLTADNCLTADTLAKVLMLFDTVDEAKEWIDSIQQNYPSIDYWIVVR